MCGRPAPRWARVERAAYTPNEASAAAYDRLYAEYRELHDYFGRGGNDVMHRLKALRREVLGVGGRRREPGGRRRRRRRRGERARACRHERDREAIRAHPRARSPPCTPSSSRNGLVVWTGGNVSGRVPGADLFVIKPSGVDYDDLAPENMILCDLDGDVVAGHARQRPFALVSDTAAHAYVYRNMPEVGGVVHTHSTYATAWAARGEPIPCVITAMADEFGGDIPVGPVRDHRRRLDRPRHRRDARAVTARAPCSCRTTAPFTIGSDARDAVKAAVMTEDVARTVHIARQGGPLVPIPQDAIDALFDRYQNVYGQNPEGALS